MRRRIGADHNRGRGCNQSFGRYWRENLEVRLWGLGGRASSVGEEGCTHADQRLRHEVRGERRRWWYDADADAGANRHADAVYEVRHSDKDFYGHVATTLNMPRAMAPHVQALSDLEFRWQAEFQAYGLTAGEFVEAWLTPPDVGPLAVAWRGRITYLKQTNSFALQTLLAQLSEWMDGMPVSPSAPPTFVVKAWRLAGCPDPSDFVANDVLFPRSQSGFARAAPGVDPES
jgi:hypothetical protein